jgi:hypothetical protein
MLPRDDSAEESAGDRYEHSDEEINITDRHI